MRLSIVYHRPFYRDPDGALWEAEGSFSRYVEAMARHVDEVVICVPRRARPFAGRAYRLRAGNVSLVGLPFFDSLPRFYAGLPRMLSIFWRQLPRWDVVNLRIPTPLGVYAFALAGLRNRDVFLLVVGDLAGVAGSVRVNSPKRTLYRAYLALEDRLQERMVGSAPSFVNGQALYAKYNRPDRRVLLTTTSTISKDDIHAEGSQRPPIDEREPENPIRLLCVSRVDPRKGLRFLPSAVADLVSRGYNVQLTIIGPIVGSLGADEVSLVTREAAILGVANRIDFVGSKTLPEVLDAAMEHDVFVLPTLPGEGVPRVLLEAMATGLPIVASDVAGVPTLVAHGVNGLLVPPADSRSIADSVERLIHDGQLRHQLVENGLRVASAHTVEAHANKIVLGLRKLTGIVLTQTQPRPASVG